MSSNSRKQRREAKREAYKKLKIRGRDAKTWERNMVNQMVDMGLAKNLYKTPAGSSLPPPSIAFQFDIPYFPDAFTDRPRLTRYYAKISPADYMKEDLENATLTRYVIPAFNKWQAGRDVLGYPKLDPQTLMTAVTVLTLGQYLRFWKICQRHGALFEGHEDHPFVFTPAKHNHDGQFELLNAKELESSAFMIDRAIEALPN